MAFLKLFIIHFLLLVILPQTQLAQCNTLKANISCLDCQSNYDFSGNMIVVKCKKVKKVSVAITEGNGSFETRLPSDSECIAKLVGGPEQLYASRKDMASTVIKYLHLGTTNSNNNNNNNIFTIATPLKFSTNKPPMMKQDLISDSKTIDLIPLPSQWGFPPLTYYLPILPIIGIP